MFTSKQLHNEELRQRYLSMIDRPDVFPTRTNWKFITENRMKGLAKALYRKYLTALTIDDNDREELHDIAIEEFPKYIVEIDRKEAVEAIYIDVVSAPQQTSQLIRQNNFFDARGLMNLIRRGYVDFAIDHLDVYQPEYYRRDLEAMEQLLQTIDDLPRLGKIKLVPGVFTKNEKYICPDGHVNSPETEYCTHAGCGKNARGLNEKQEAAISLFAGRIKVLKGMFKEEQKDTDEILTKIREG